MRRKLIKFGKNSYVISIPKDWIDRNTLGKGDELYLDISPQSITIYPGDPEHDRDEKTLAIPIDGKELPRIHTEIVSAYLLGYTMLTISGDSIAKFRKEIKNIIINLAGLEIVEVGKRSIVAKDMLSIKDISLEANLRRIDMTVRMMISECVSKDPKEAYESLFETDMDVNRLVFLVFRMLHSIMEDYTLQRKMKLSIMDIHIYWDLVMRLEKVGDQSKRIARWLQGAKYTTKSYDELVAIQDCLSSHYKEVMASYYKKDKDKAITIEVGCRDDIEMCDAFLRRHGDMHSAEIIENFKSMSTAIKNMSRTVINATHG
ncbi:MAG: phosphate uptake regulator PhoU [archaeon]